MILLLALACLAALLAPFFALGTSRLRLRQPPRGRRRVVELVVDSMFGRWMFGRNWGGFTLPLPFVTVIFYWHEEPHPLVRVHEFVHVAQTDEAWVGAAWYRYLREAARNGYAKNRFEVQAYAIEASAREYGLPEWAQPPQ